MPSTSTFRFEITGLLGCDFRYRHRRFQLQKRPKISPMIVIDDTNHTPHFLSDIPGDPGSQLPYQEFSPYYLAPILLAFPISLRKVARAMPLPLCASGIERERSRTPKPQNPPGSGMGNHQSDRSQVIGGKLLIGQLAPWVTWDI